MSKDGGTAPLGAGNEIELAVDKLAFGGKGLGRAEGLVVFVDRAIPGQRVRARVTAAKKRFAEAELLEVLDESPAAAEPFCPHFGPCGGCLWQNLRYDEQVAWKGRFVEESLHHLAGARAGAGETLVLPPLASPEQRYYRNKMEFSFAGRGRELRLGLHRRQSDRILDLDVCFLQSELSVRILKVVREFCRESGVAAYDPRIGRGYWRFLVIRESKATGEVLANLITAPKGPAEAVSELASVLRERVPELRVVHSVRRAPTQVAYGSPVLAEGGDFVEEVLDGLRFRVSANSFFQTNSLGAERLYAEILHLAALSGGERVLDLYCGSGGISLWLARAAGASGRVTGFETTRSAVADAADNARANGLENCRFVAGELEDNLEEMGEERPDLVVTDPPRDGMSPEVVRALLTLAPPKIVYVSCNPATQARDTALLLERYRPVAVRPVDMFPHTAHVESVLLLERKS